MPANTTLTFWLPHGGGLNDWAGQKVETGGNFANLIDLYKEKNLVLEVYEPYNEVPNYTLTPGKDLTMVQQPGSKSFIADRTYTLEDLMDKFQGRNTHWIACRTVSNTMTTDELWGAAKGNRDDREKLAYAKKTLWSGHKNKEGLIQQLRGKLARLENEMQIEEQKQGGTRDGDKIANLEDEIFECESEIRLHKATINEHQTIEDLKNQDRIKKQKYIKTQVHHQAWQDRWR